MAEDTPLTEAQIEQFETALVEFCTTQNDANLRDVFKLFDRNGDGKITARELKTAMSSIDNADVPLEDCNEMINEADTNGDGVVDVNEFIDMMKKTFAE